MKKRSETEVFSGIATLILSIAALVLFCMSYTTGYYVFGEMESKLIALLLGAAIALEAAAIVINIKFPDVFWTKLPTFGVTGLLAAAAAMLLGDRVAGIGNCIITDYDSGHGGEEAVYMSLAGIMLMLLAVVYNIIGSFSKDKKADETAAGNGKILKAAGFGITCIAALLAVLIPTAFLAGWELTPGGNSGEKGAAYKISYNQKYQNLDNMPDYQFQCGDLSGLAKYEARLYVDVALTLDGKGNYNLFSETYIIEGDRRAEVGDATGIGLVMNTNAEGTYVENEDGTITTFAAAHAVYELKTDTYSAQMKDTSKISVNGSSEDGTYDSAEYSEVLEFVPETIWTLNEDGTIASYHRAGEEPATEEEETKEAETGAEETEGEEKNATADKTGVKELEIASEDGATTMTFYSDGSYRFFFEQHGIEDKGTYSYDGTVLTTTNANGTESKAEGDPLKLHYVSSQSDQLTGDYTISAAELADLG